MKKNTMLKRLKLTEESFEKIQQAVKKSESKTSGEIAVAVVAESASYSVYELFFSLLMGVLLFGILLPFSNKIEEAFIHLFWASSFWHLPAFFGVSCFGFTAIMFWVMNIPAIDRFIIPNAVKKKTVYNRALRHFVESGVYSTSSRSGILIFVSFMEQEVRIIADSGINQKISPELWNLIASDLAEGLGTSDATNAFIRTIDRCGELLQEFFPLEEGSKNSDELPNGLVILEEEEWL